MGSADIAKERLLWCVKGRRDGGYWVGIDWQYCAYMSLEGEYHKVPTWPISARWVYA